MLGNDDWRMRLAGAKVLERIKVKQFYHPLENLLQDENIHVQRGAIQAAGEIKSPFLLPILVEKLKQSKTKRVATVSLSKYGNDAIKPLASILENINYESEIRIHIPKILRLIGTQECLNVLINSLNLKNNRIRNNIISEVSHMVLSNRQLKLNIEKIKNHIEAETKNYYQQIIILSVFGNKINDSLLSEVLHLRMNSIIQRVLYLLTVSHPDDPIESISYGFKSPDPFTRSNSIELLDNILESEHKQPILTMLEDEAMEKKLRLCQTYFQGLKKDSFIGWLQQLLDDDNRWTVACTIYQIGILKIQKLSPNIEKVLAGEDPLLIETALISLKSLMETSSYNKLLGAVAEKNHQAADIMRNRLNISIPELL
jgi:HEAT repeat protein